MGCNGHNHYPDCDCGWGGDTGGGYGGSASPIRIRCPDGQDWLPHRSPGYTSYVNPNATCPVCGDNVFFYQSPYGGRVFFDELGPPWPKHPCTDTYVQNTARYLVLPATGTYAQRLPEVRDPTIWQPLLIKDVDVRDLTLRLEIDPITKIPGKYLFVPRTYAYGQPLFWRRNARRSSAVELSTFLVNNEQVQESKLTVSAWYRSDEQRHGSRGQPKPDADALNALGWWWSFAWRGSDQEDWTNHPGVNLRIARKYFVAAAKAGSWAAWNNLGVMVRDGIGKAASPNLGFRLFKRAARSGDATPLRHLAECYRMGIGTRMNTAKALKLDAMVEEATTAKKIPPTLSPRM